jgi:hypothetical protein
MASHGIASSSASVEQGEQAVLAGDVMMIAAVNSLWGEGSVKTRQDKTRHE